MNEFLNPGSYAFSWYAVPVVVVGALNWLLGAVMFRRERGSPVSVTLLAMTLSIGVWLLGMGGANAATDPAVAHTWLMISMVGTAFVPVCAFMHAARGSAKLHLMRGIAGVGVVVSSTFAVLGLSTNLVIDHAHHYFWGYYPVYGPLGPLVIIYYGLFFVGGGILYRIGHKETKSETNQRRMKLRLLALAAALPAMVDFLATMHVEVYPFGYLFILGYISISTYSIWKYRLIDITPALASAQVIETMTEGLLVADRDGVIRVANSAAAAVWRAERSLAGTSISELDARWRHDALGSLLDPEREQEREVQFDDGSGRKRVAIVSSSRLLDHLEAWVGTVYIVHDITERWHSEERFRSLVQNASDLILVIDPDTRVLYQSPSIRRVLGYDAESTIGQRILDVVHADDAPQFVASLSDLMTKPTSRVTGEGRVRDNTGEWRHVEFTGSDQRANPAIGGLVLNIRDVSERKVLEEQLRHQALHDPLTRLANRARFGDRLEHALARQERSHAALAVLFMDLDNFKGVNDSLGHGAGDQLLVQVADRLKLCLRPGDTIARLGGDEFAILLEDVTSADDVTAVAERMFEELAPPFDLVGKEVLVRASIGIAPSNDDQPPAASVLLREADIAMYVAKSQGKGCYRVFDPSMETSMVERLELLTDFPRALEHEEFVLQYQPIFLLRDGQLSGVEALVRWQHPRRGLMPPHDFIPLAEESGTIVELGKWVLNRACSQAAAWQRRFPSRTHWTISVNVSAKQLHLPSFVDHVREALTESGLAPDRLILELTESVMMEDVNVMLRRLRELKAVGVGLAIDDFGTGYSSLGYLRQFPFDILKIDKSFVDDLGVMSNQRELTSAIVELGKTLGLELVAEGIERDEQLSRLQTMDCEQGQGFLFARPLDEEGVDRLLSELSLQQPAA